MDVQTTVGIARTGTKSLKVTIPTEIVTYLDLKIGDKLEWKMEGSVARPSATVRKAKKD